MVAKKTKATKNNKLLGVDRIPPRLIMETVEQVSIPLTRVFNLSLKDLANPSEWKEANIIPLFKKGSRKKSEWKEANIIPLFKKGSIRKSENGS